MKLAWMQRESTLFLFRTNNGELCMRTSCNMLLHACEITHSVCGLLNVFSKKETRAYLILNLTMIKMLTVWCYDRSGKLKIWDLL